MNKRAKIFVTGGAGVVGRAVVAELVKNEQFHVVVFDKFHPKEKNLPFAKEATYIVGDIKNKKDLVGVLLGVDVVLHLAADIGALQYMEDLQADILTENASIDAVLYPALVDAEVKTLIYSSSSMVFQHAHVYPYKESDLATTPPPTNVYGFSKLLGEYFCRSFAKQYGLQYVIMRYHNIYGGEESVKGEGAGYLHVIPALIEKVKSGQYPIEILGSPDDTRPFTHIDDAVSATVRLVEEVVSHNPQVINQDFNIGQSKANSIFEAATVIWQEFGDGREFQFVSKEVQSDTAKRREMTAAKITAVTGWEAQVSLEEGIKALAKQMK